MNLLANRGRLLSGVALGFGLTMAAAQPARADSACLIGVIDVDTIGADCTSVNGNGHSEADHTGVFALVVPGPTSLLAYSGDLTSALTTGYIETTTAGRGVLNFNTTQAFTYVGTGSTLFGDAAATGATMLTIAGPSVTLNSGNIIAAGTGTNALTVVANGGAGAGAINVTVDGLIQAAGAGILLAQSNAAATGNILLTSTAGNPIIAGDGAAINILAGGSGTITVNLGEDVTADNGTALNINASNAAAGAIDVTTVAGSEIRASAGDGITINTAGSGNVTVGNNAAILSGAGGANTLQNGISATSNGTGGVTVFSGLGAVGTLADRAQLVGISAGITNAASAGTVQVVAGAGGVASVGNAVVATTNGTGVVAVTTNGTVDSFNGNGVTTSATTGTTAITTTGIVNAGGIGISSTSTDGGQVISTSGAITAAGNGIDASATGSGAITIIQTGPQLTSNGGDGIVAATTTGTISITAAAISAASDGIVTTSTTGNQLIASTGNIDATTGILATSTTGGITINATGGTISGTADGINATSTSGNLTVNVNGGDVDGAGAGILLATGGDKVVNVAIGDSVTGGILAIGFSGGATGTLFNSGTVGTIGGVAVASDVATAATINNSSQGTLNGAVDLSDQVDTINNGGIWNVGVGNSFYAGADVFNNLITGTANIVTGTVFDSLETLVNAGTINAAGTVSFTTAATVLTNSGTINLNAATVTGLGAVSNIGTINTTGTTSISNTGDFTNASIINAGGPLTITSTGAFTNSGTLNLAAGNHSVTSTAFTSGGTIRAEGGTTNLTVSSVLANSGTIDLADGANNDQLTIFGDFAGSGGSSLLLDVGDISADQLIITGAATGSTTINANLIGTGVLDSGNVLLVTTGSATADAFVLGDVTGNTSPLIDYSLEESGDQFFLVGALNEAGFTPLPVTLVAGEMWYQSAEAVWAQAKLPNDGTNPPMFWGQIYASRDKAGGTDGQSVAGIESDVDNRVETDRMGFQVGAGFALGLGSVGVTGGIERADADGEASNFETRGWNIGAYGMFGGTTGFHGSVLAKHDRFDIDIGNALFDDIDQDARSNGIDGEVGYRFGGTAGPAFGVSAGLSHVRTKIDDISLEGLDYDYDRLTSTRGRVGVRATGSGPMSPFLDVRAYREFSGDGDVRLSDGVDSYRLRADGRGTWMRAEAGIGGPASGLAPMVSVWVDVGDVKGFGGRGSFRF